MKQEHDARDSAARAKRNQEMASDLIIHVEHARVRQAENRRTERSQGDSK